MLHLTGILEAGYCGSEFDNRNDLQKQLCRNQKQLSRTVETARRLTLLCGPAGAVNGPVVALNEEGVRGPAISFVLAVLT